MAFAHKRQNTKTFIQILKIFSFSYYSTPVRLRNKSCHQASGTVGRSQTYLQTYLQGDPWSAQDVLGERHHQARLEEDCNYGCGVCSQATGMNPPWIWRIILYE